jgi:hypothetical protein
MNVDEVVDAKTKRARRQNIFHKGSTRTIVGYDKALLSFNACSLLLYLLFLAFDEYVLR